MNTTSMNRNHRDLVRSAREMYQMMSKLQKLMLDMFFEEFCDLEEEEQRVLIEKTE